MPEVSSENIEKIRAALSDAYYYVEEADKLGTLLRGKPSKLQRDLEAAREIAEAAE